MSGPIIINAPRTFVRIEVRRMVDGRDVIESAEVVRADALDNFFGENGFADWLRRLNEAPFRRRT